MKKLLLLVLFSGLICVSMAQISTKSSPPLKGNGEVFFIETFDWEDPDDPKGWKAPEGYYMEDPTDNGFNWHWWGYDSLFTPNLTREPPMESSSSQDGSLCLFLDLYNHRLFLLLDQRLFVNLQ